MDRLFFVSLFQLGHGVVDNIVTINPSTVLAWHRKLAARRIVGEVRHLGKVVGRNFLPVTFNCRYCFLKTPLRIGAYGHEYQANYQCCRFKKSQLQCFYREVEHAAVREELLDDRIAFGERDLRCLLKESVEYFNENRAHQSREKDSPSKKHGKIDSDRSKIRPERLVAWLRC